MNPNIEKEKLRILVTGGAGFIGSWLIKKLLDTTSSKIFNLDKLSYASDLTLINSSANISNHHLLNVDLRNKKELKTAIEISNPDIIFHLAAESHVDRSIDDSTPFIESNIVGTYNILEIAKDHWLNLNKVRREKFRFLHVSTDEVFGSLGKKGKFNENTAYDPRSPYSASKASSDHLTSAWFHTYNFPVIRTNCSNNFGPYQFPEKLIPLVINKALQNKEIPIYGDGKNIRDWLYVKDHVEALLLVITKGIIGQKYCIGGNNEKTNIEIVTKICNKLDNFYGKSSHKNLIKFVKDRPGHDRRYAIDSSLIKRELNWEPSHKFDDALDRTIEWYLKNNNWLKKIQSKNIFADQRIGIKNSKI